MSIPKAPCKGCKEPIRHPGCHDTCERYLKFKADKLVYNLQLGEIKGNNVYFKDKAKTHTEGSDKE